MIKLRVKDKDRQIDNDIGEMREDKSVGHRRGLTLFTLLCSH